MDQLSRSTSDGKLTWAANERGRGGETWAETKGAKLVSYLFISDF